MTLRRPHQPPNPRDLTPTRLGITCGPGATYADARPGQGEAHLRNRATPSSTTWDHSYGRTSNHDVPILESVVSGATAYVANDPATGT